MFKDNHRKNIFGLLLLSSLTLFLGLMVSQVSAVPEGFCIGEDCVYNWWGTGTTNYLSRWTGSQTIADSVVYQSGTNIGIGTTTPAQKLHVAGYARADSGFCIGTSCITAWPEGEVTGTGTANYLPIWTTSSNIGNSTIYQSGTNVGIGTTSPRDKFDVSGNIYASNYWGANRKSFNFSYSSTVRYYHIARLPATSSGTGDALHIETTGIQNSIAGKGKLKVAVGQREGFWYRKSYDGGNPRVHVVVYRQENNTSDVYVYTPSPSFTSGEVTYYQYGWTASVVLYDNPSASSSTPAGTLIFDSNDDTTYPVNDPIMVGNGIFTGNVGIGTTSPAQKLHVAGYARADSGFCIGTSCITAWPQGEVTGTGTTNYLPLWTTSSNIGNSVVYQSGSNVGIGTTSPGAKLDVNGVIKGSTLTDGIVTWSAAQFNRTNGNIEMQWSGSGNNGVRFFGNTAYPVIFTGSGSVGIGTTSPAQKLHVAGYARADSGFCIGTSCITAWPEGEVTGTGTANYLPRWTTSSNIGNSVIYQSGSNIGIGITSPSQQLEITGNFRVSTTTYANQSGIIYKGADRFIHDFNYGYNGAVTTQGMNTFVGIQAGNFTMGSTATQTYEASRNTAIGHSALSANTTGYDNSAMGTYALRRNTTGSYNSAMGIGALHSNTTGYNNSAMGESALMANTTGSYNSAMGSYALNYNTTGSRNSAMGESALMANTTGSYNSAIGVQAGMNLADGNNNETSSNSVFLGYYTRASVAGGNNEIVIGASAIGAGSNSVVLGNDNITKTLLKGNVGIGATSPAQKLHVAGYARADSGFCIGTSCITAWPTGGVTGTGTANYLPRWTTSSNIGNSVIYQSGSNIGIGITSPNQQLEITGNFRVPTTTYANQSGIIYKGGSRFIHDFNYGNNGTVTTEGGNTFVGINAGNFMMGSTATASFHSSQNTGIGLYVLSANTTGYANSAMGMWALYSNTTGYYNSAMGRQALYSNTTGHDNSAIGAWALYANTTGSYNSAIGMHALYANTTGSYNSAMGVFAGRYLADGSTANQTSSNSVFLGYDTRASVAGGSNEIVIGASAIGAGSNSVVLGNDSITKTLLKGNVGIGMTSPSEKLDVNGNVRANEFYYSSDASLKMGIGYLPGEEMLSKVLQLQGVSFNWKATGEKSIGFIAQDVEKIFPEAVATDANGLKSISYSKLIAPLTEAIKEQQKQIEFLMAEIEQLKQ